MKKWFVVGVLLWVVFELASVWLIMPLPYSQRARSIDVAYALHQARWVVRAVCAAVLLAALTAMWRGRGVWRAMAALGVLLVAGVGYVTNVTMAADQIFRMPNAVDMQPASRNAVDTQRLVVGVERNGEARAYPVQFIGYHHQVRDSVGGEPILVTFCTVCRTGRVFSPVVRGQVEQFRLVGMDHFNAMLEDKRTGTWWRQANGEAVAGALRGDSLREIPSQQVSLATWLAMHPSTLIMQPDSALRDKYSASYDYEKGTSRSALTGTDTVSWSEKSWVVGVTVNGASKAYDWNRLRRERMVHDVVGGVPLVVFLASDNASYFAYRRPDASTRFTMVGDSLDSGSARFGLSGRGATGALTPVQASQEFWHSWRTFQPNTSRY